MGNSSTKFETCAEALAQHQKHMASQDIDGMDSRARAKFDELSHTGTDGKTKVITLEQYAQLMNELHYHAPEDHVHRLSQSSSAGRHVMTWDEFDTALQGSISMPDLSAVFTKYDSNRSSVIQGGAGSYAASAPNHLLSLEDFCAFLVCEQGMTVAQAKAAIASDMVHPTERSAGGISLHRFNMIVGTNHTNAAFDPVKSKLYQDMTQPLSSYFICSSHNTFLETDQLKGESSALAVKNAIRKVRFHSPALSSRRTSWLYSSCSRKHYMSLISESI